MQKTSIKKFSILGFVLIAASAVTAAVAPGKKPDKEYNANNGSLRQVSTDGDYSCVPNTPATGVTCTLTEMSETTDKMIDGSSVTLNEGFRDTQANTSLTGLGGADSIGGA